MISRYLKIHTHRCVCACAHAHILQGKGISQTKGRIKINGKVLKLTFIVVFQLPSHVQFS